jgi:hypothetical protein
MTEMALNERTKFKLRNKFFRGILYRDKIFHPRNNIAIEESNRVVALLVDFYPSMLLPPFGDL